ncbi:MAG: RDD family protein [Candidatus Acidiferrales bacterium]
MYCSKCGKEVNEGAAFCSACGAAMASPPIAPDTAGPSYASPVQPSWTPQASTGYAGFWLRLVAYIIDGILVGAVFGVLGMFSLIFVGIGSLRTLMTDLNTPDAVLPAAFVSVLIIVGIVGTLATWLYYAYMESSTYQATLGKMALGLYVTDLNGQRLSFGRASGRFFAKLISGLIPLAIGYIMAGFTARKQALHDIIAGCLVLRKL